MSAYLTSVAWNNSQEERSVGSGSASWYDMVFYNKNWPSTCESILHLTKLNGTMFCLPNPHVCRLLISNECDDVS